MCSLTEHMMYNAQRENTNLCNANTVEPLLRVHPDQRPPPLERPLHNVNLNINVLISTPDERPPLLKGHFSDAKGVVSQEGFHCNDMHAMWRFPLETLVLYLDIVSS